jgi:hypothetical protein
VQDNIEFITLDKIANLIRIQKIEFFSAARNDFVLTAQGFLEMSAYKTVATGY